MTSAPATFVLVPGGWQGGWIYDPVAGPLRARGHEVHALTFRGLEPDPDDEGRAANLDTQVDQVAELVESLAGPVVLCGHSYAGMVIASIADRLPHRIAHLVHIEAYVPADGDSCFSLTSDHFRGVFIAGAARDGRTIAVPPELDERARPHPLAAMVQAVRLSARAARRPYPRSFVYGGPWEGSPFVDVAARLRDDPRWTVHELPVGHNPMRRAPEALVDLLTAVAGQSDVVANP